MASHVLSVRLAQARVARKLTQAALAAAAGVPHVMMVSGWERGRNLPRVDYLVAVGRVLGVTLDWLCGLSEQGGPPWGRVLDSNTSGGKTPGNRRKHGRKRQAIAGSRRGRIH